MHSFCINNITGEETIYGSQLGGTAQQYYPPTTQPYPSSHNYPEPCGYPSPSDYPLPQSYPVTQQFQTSMPHLATTQAQQATYKGPATYKASATYEFPTTQTHSATTQAQPATYGETSTYHKPATYERSPTGRETVTYEEPATYERHAAYHESATGREPATYEKSTYQKPATCQKPSSYEGSATYDGSATYEDALTYRKSATDREPLTYEGAYSRTPSPGDSGIDTGLSPATSPKPHTDDVDQILIKLSQKSNSLLKPDPEASSDEKPQHSFFALVSMAILNSPDRKLLLGDIYRYIMDNFPYYNNDKKAWRNSVRHNLSLNECFTKNGRSDCGKASYWSIHTAVADDFAKGDFRRRQARRKSRSKVKLVSNDADKSIGYVTMTPSSIGYHPYGTAAYYPQYTRAETTSGLRLSAAAPSYIPNNDSYQYSYHHDTSRNTSPTGATPSAYFSQLPGYDTMTSQPRFYSNNYISGTFPSGHVTAVSPDNWGLCD